MDTIEQYTEGTEQESYVAYVYLLEQLSNCISDNKLDPKYIDGLAGPNSKNHIHGYDRFHGTKTPGFY